MVMPDYHRIHDYQMQLDMFIVRHQLNSAEEAVLRNLVQGALFESCLNSCRSLQSKRYQQLSNYKLPELTYSSPRWVIEPKAL
jgi:hypothetical protein